MQLHSEFLPPTPQGSLAKGGLKSGKYGNIKVMKDLNYLYKYSIINYKK